MSKRERPMQEAARELLRRQHEGLGTPLVCDNPAVYAVVAKLLREPMPNRTDEPPTGPRE